jgi:DNA-binding ferritin-like protein
MQSPQRGLLKRPSTQNAPAMKTAAMPANCEAHVAMIATELMNAATSFHKLHLKVTGSGSFSAHKALNEIYDALPGYADSLVEGYQGAAECLLTYPEIAPRVLNTVDEAIAYCREFKLMITSLQEMLEYSEIINDLDIVKSGFNSLKYKLMFLQ